MPVPYDQAPLVGRERERAIVRERLRAAGEGAGGVALIAGEAGIGKTRLVAETKADAAQCGYAVLEGACFAFDHAVPFAPLLDLLRGRMIGCTPEQIEHLFGPTAPELVKLLPELSTRRPNVIVTPPLAPEQEKRRLFHALVEFLALQTGERPLLVVVEDLHWADETTLECLPFLAQHLAVYPVLFLLTYRSDEIAPALASMTAALARQRHAVEIALGRLAPPEVKRLLRAILAQQRPVRAEFLDVIYGLTEGNPFFVEEVIRALIAAGEIYFVDGAWERRPVHELRIPRTVHAAVQQRTARLSAAARELLNVAAIAGRRFDFALLEAVTEREERELVRLLRELVMAQLIVEESADLFAFRHALTREAIYASVLGRERRALHRTIAAAMARVYATEIDAHLAELAYHAAEAEVWADALRYGQQAGERALALYAPHAAVDQLSRALTAAAHLPGTPLSALYRARGQAYDTLGDFERARADYEAALALARTAADRRTEWQALADLGFLWASRDYGRTGELLRQALDVARREDDRPLLAHSLNRLGNWHTNVEEPQLGLQLHTEALQIFEALLDKHGIAETVDLLAMASVLNGDKVRGAVFYERAVALFAELGEQQSSIFALVMLMICRTADYEMVTMVDARSGPAEFTAEGEAARRVAQEIGFRSGEAFALLGLALCLGPRGMYAAGLQRAQETLTLAEEMGHRQWMAGAHYVLGALYFDVGSLPAARRHLEQALTLARELGSLNWQRLAAGYLALTCVREGDYAQAAAVLDVAVGVDAPTQTVGQRFCWYARAHLALARGEGTRALEIADRLIATAANCTPSTVIPNLWYLRGMALSRLGRTAEAEAVLQAAAREADTLEQRPMLWRLHTALGNVYRVQRRRDAAEREFAAARSVVDELAAQLPDEPVAEAEVESPRRAFLQAATATLPQSRPATSLRVAKQVYGGLTAREREVAALVAAGKSNRDIAEALVVGERTVEYHVQNILAKLDATSRAQIAAWAVAHGLT